ncbi:MAG: PilZ domain-containing protein [Phycisphaera sp. RhM]|nr:PilZ domain-containing protein [Phycisphaera sp. RhM]
MNSAPNTAIDTSQTQSVADQIGLDAATGADEIHCLILSSDGYTGHERRASRRVPRTLEISVQPMDVQMKETGRSFFAITRDISQGGLAFLSSQKSDFEKAVVSLNDGVAPGIVCRICHSSLVHSSGPEEVWLTNVEYLHLHRPRK